MKTPSWLAMMTVVSAALAGCAGSADASDGAVDEVAQAETLATVMAGDHVITFHAAGDGLVSVGEEMRAGAARLVTDDAKRVAGDPCQLFLAIAGTTDASFVPAPLAKACARRADLASNPLPRHGAPASVEHGPGPGHAKGAGPATTASVPRVCESAPADGADYVCRRSLAAPTSVEAREVVEVSSGACVPADATASIGVRLTYQPWWSWSTRQSRNVAPGRCYVEQTFAVGSSTLNATLAVTDVPAGARYDYAAWDRTGP